MTNGGERLRAYGVGFLLSALLALGLAGCTPPATPGEGARSSAASGQRSTSAAPAPAAPPSLTHLRIASTAIAASVAPLWLAQDTGIFERNGLDVEIVSLPAGPQAVQAMLAGELEVAYNVASSLISANLGGADLVMVAGGVNTMIFSISAAPGIERVEDLRGKRLGITRLGTSSDFNARYVLARYGLQADTDVAFIQLNGIPEILTGLHAGAIDAGMLSHPIVVQAREQGFRPLLDLGTLGIPYQHTGVMATRRYVEDHRDVIRAVVRSHVEAIQRFKSDRAAAIETLARWTKLSEPLLLDETYDAYANIYFERVPYVTIPGMQLDLDALAGAAIGGGGARVESWVDNSFMEELERGGVVGR
jgi:NitT/TauT family transport system substrate-binding protein